jgi:hypothetical protein
MIRIVKPTITTKQGKMPKKKPRIIELTYQIPGWSKLTECQTQSQAFSAGVDYACDVIIGLIGHAVFRYPPSSVNTVSASINQCRSCISNCKSTDGASMISCLQAFHAGATTALKNISPKAVNRRIKREVKEIIMCVEILVHHEFVRLMELVIYDRRLDPYSVRRMNELRKVRRMVGVIKLMR